MRLAQLGPKRDYDEHRKSMYEASGRASEFIKGIQKITEHLDASNFSLIKPICGFIDEQLMKKPENGTECVFLLLVTKFIWRSHTERIYSIMVMASISIMSLSYLQSKLEPIIKGDKTLMAQPIVSLSPEEQGLGTVVIDDGTTVGPIEISAESLRVMDATKRVNIMAYVQSVISSVVA